MARGGLGRGRGQWFKRGGRTYRGPGEVPSQGHGTRPGMMDMLEGLHREALEEQHVSKTQHRGGCLEGAGQKETDLRRDCTPWRRGSCIADRKLIFRRDGVWNHVRDVGVAL